MLTTNIKPSQINNTLKKNLMSNAVPQGGDEKSISPTHSATSTSTSTSERAALFGGTVKSATASRSAAIVAKLGAFQNTTSSTSTSTSSSSSTSSPSSSPSTSPSSSATPSSSTISSLTTGLARVQGSPPSITQRINAMNKLTTSTSTSTSTSCLPIPSTSPPPHDEYDIIHTQTCKLYQLISGEWKAVGEGEAQFRRYMTKTHHRGRSRSDVTNDGGKRTSLHGMIHLTMSDASSSSPTQLIMHHIIHPLTELKPNGNIRSWTWTVSDQIRGSHVTLAVKFKTSSGADLFKQQYEMARTSNGEEREREKIFNAKQWHEEKNATNNKKPPTSSPVLATPRAIKHVTIANHTEEDDVNDDQDHDEEYAEPRIELEDDEQPVPPPSTSPPPPSIATDVRSRTNTIADPIPIPTIPPIPTSSPKSTSKQLTSVPQTPRVPRVLDLFPVDIEDEEETTVNDNDVPPPPPPPTETKVEPTSEYCKRFPRKRSIRYIRRRIPNFHHVSSHLDDREITSRITVLRSLNDLLHQDRTEIQRMMNKLRDENAALEALLKHVHDTDVNIHMQSLHTCATVNHYLHQQTNTLKLSLEAMRRQLQFKLGSGKHRSLDGEDKSSLPSAPLDDPDTSSVTTLSQVRSAVARDAAYSALTDKRESSAPDRHPLRAEVIRFDIHKMNKIRKNSPRWLELDLTTKSLTICKKTRSMVTDIDDDLTTIIVNAKTIRGVELNSKNECILELTYLATQERQARAIKQWRLLFNTREERERFYRLLHIHVFPKGLPKYIPPEPSLPAAAVMSAAANLMSVLTQKPTIPATSPPPMHPPHHREYIPQPMKFSKRIQHTTAQLPVRAIADKLHTMWMMQRKQEGWKYGKTLDELRKTHPNLLPLKQLPPSRYEQNALLVRQTLSAVQALGFTMIKTGRDDDGHTKMMYGGGSIAKELLQLIEFLAEDAHEMWAEDKFTKGWKYAPVKSTPDKRHPHLQPYVDLPSTFRERQRNISYKILGSLVEFGYSITNRQSMNSNMIHASPPKHHTMKKRESPHSYGGKSLLDDDGSSSSSGSSSSNVSMGTSSDGSVFGSSVASSSSSSMLASSELSHKSNNPMNKSPSPQLLGTSVFKKATMHFR